MKKAYSPYSHFSVGSVVVGGSGKTYTGCNVENASYGATICAERVAITHAVASGETKITKVFIVNSSKRPCPPCGLCLQVIAEFAKDTEVTCASSDLKKTKTYSLKELLPQAFERSFTR